MVEVLPIPPPPPGRTEKQEKQIEKTTIQKERLCRKKKKKKPSFLSQSVQEQPLHIYLSGLHADMRSQVALPGSQVGHIHTVQYNSCDMI